jgi:hypothetical protein
MHGYPGSRWELRKERQESVSSQEYMLCVGGNVAGGLVKSTCSSMQKLGNSTCLIGTIRRYKAFRVNAILLFGNMDLSTYSARTSHANSWTWAFCMYMLKVEHSIVGKFKCDCNDAKRGDGRMRKWKDDVIRGCEHVCWRG